MNLRPLTDFFAKVVNRFGINYFFGQPADSIMFWFLLGAFVVFLVLVLGFYIMFRYRARQLKPYKAYSKTFFWTNLSLVAVAFVNLFARYESLQALSWRFWMYIILAVLVAFNGWFFSKRTFQLNEELITLADKKRKDKWLTPTKKRKK